MQNKKYALAYNKMKEHKQMSVITWYGFAEKYLILNDYIHSWTLCEFGIISNEYTKYRLVRVDLDLNSMNNSIKLKTILKTWITVLMLSDI